MVFERHIQRTKLLILQGDITLQSTDAIVNAANTSLMGGGGVDGAIHKAGGPLILAECKKIVAQNGVLPAGQAVITGAGNLPARQVIHTVGPIWAGGIGDEDSLLANCYINSLKTALKYNIKSISFPSISTGAYSFPVERAAQISLSAIHGFLSRGTSLHEVRMILFSERDFYVYKNVAQALPG